MGKQRKQQASQAQQASQEQLDSQAQQASQVQLDLQKQLDHEKDLERLAKLRPMDDDFMRAMFKDNIPLAQMVLRIIMAKPDLSVTSLKTQEDMKRVTGARSLCLDVYAGDSKGKKYDVEIEKSEDRANPHRARYHASVIDVENLDAGQDFKELPDVYVIFVTEKDLFKDGAAVHKIQRTDGATGKLFGDGSNILYVNGKYRGDDEIGKLMHDFGCNRAEDMVFPLMAEKTRYLKENPKGVAQMCKMMEDMREESEARGIEKGKLDEKRETALRLFEMGIDTEKIAKAVKYNVDTVRQWIDAGMAVAK